MYLVHTHFATVSGEEYVGRAVKVSGLYFGVIGLGESRLNSVFHVGFLIWGVGRGFGVLGLGLGVHIVLGGLGVLGVDSCNARGVKSGERNEGNGFQ